MRAPTLLLLLFALLALTLAAQDAPSPSLARRQNAAAAASAKAAAAADDSDEPADDSDSADNDTTTKDDTKDDTKATATPTPTATPKENAATTSSPAATTKVAQGVAATDEGSVPDLTTPTTSTKSATSTNANPNSNTDTPPSLDSDLPTLGEIEGWSKPVQKGPSPAQNPWMQTSTLPEGTVFIAVGSGLAGLALLTLIWRGLVAYFLHRSVLRASSTTAYIDPKPKPKPSPGAFYAQGPGSTLSLDHLAAGRHHTPNSSLFFSPTSNAAAQQQGQRQSTYLPAGFYASAAGQRGSVVGKPGSRGAPSTAGTERMSGMRVNESDTSLNVPATGRAPSAYLEDLFESHKGVDQPPMPPQGRY